MSAILIAAVLTFLGDPFIADATAEVEFIVDRPEAVIRKRMLDIQTLRRNMPGVVAIVDTGEGQWLYKTERSMPFSDPVRTTFVVSCLNTPVVTFQTPDPEALNWMSFRAGFRPANDHQTIVRARLRVRLVREDGRAIHILAPLVGASFISDRMRDDLERMLATFASNVREEFPSAAEKTMSSTMP
jgi:hypothetical protein